MALHTLTDPRAVRHALENRARLLAEIGCSLDDLVVAEQVHGGRVAVVTAADRGRGARQAETAVPGVDGLVTFEPGIVLLALTADCPIVCLYRESPPGLALLHAGWRGLASGVIGAGSRALGRGGEKLSAYLSACAGPCCYEVGGEVAERFPGSVRRGGGGSRSFLDLPAAVARALGFGPIRLSEKCTICNSSSFSYRRTGGPERQGVLAVLGRKGNGSWNP